MDLAEIGYLRIPQILKLLRICESTLWLWVSKGEFPRPIKLSRKVTVWRVKDVREWIENKNTMNRVPLNKTNQYRAQT